MTSILQHTKLKNLILCKTKIQLVKTLEPLFNKFQTLDIRDLSMDGKIMMFNGALKVFSEKILKETERNKYYDSPGDCVFDSKSDIEIYRHLKNLFSREEYERNPYVPEPHFGLILYTKKSVLGPPRNVLECFIFFTNTKGYSK